MYIPYLLPVVVEAVRQVRTVSQDPKTNRLVVTLWYRVNLRRSTLKFRNVEHQSFSTIATLRECSLFEEHRHILSSTDACFDDPDWTVGRLGEPNYHLPGFVEFLRKSGAFTKTASPFHLSLLPDLPPFRKKKPPDK